MDPTASRIEPPFDRPPPRPFRVTFLVAQTGQTVVVPVDPGEPAGAASDVKSGLDGLPGSLLQIALSAGVPIQHACGGVCACATCHVIVREGLESCGRPSDAEEDQLDHAAGLTRHSRLACRAVPDGTRDLLVEVPAWNRNLAAERD